MEVCHLTIQPASLTLQENLEGHSAQDGLKVSILGSGSSGNSAVISCGETHVLLDCGFSGKEIQRRLKMVGIDETEIQAILVTHEHGDHVQSAHTLSNRLEVPIYTTEGTFDSSFSEKKFYDWIEIQSGHSFSLGEISIHPVTLPHDAADPVGFRFEARDRICAHITDCGYPSGPVVEALKGSHSLIVEANYDHDMLRDGPYPWSLKQRIASRIGHLSNDSLLEIFESILSEETRSLTLAHISENNNHPGILGMQTKKKLIEIGLPDLPFVLAKQHTPTIAFFV